MAMSGSYSYKSSSYNEFNLTISWEVIKQSVEDNTSTLKWTATFVGEAGNTEYGFGIYRVGITVDGKESFYFKSLPMIYSSTPTITRELGTMTIPHISTTETRAFKLTEISVNYSLESNSGSQSGNKTKEASQTYYIDPVAAAVKVTAAPDFNDEENPTISYKKSYNLQTGAKVYAAISFTGGTDDVPYREISENGTSYTFNLTDEERKALRLGITSGSVKTVRFYIKTTFSDGESTWHYLTKNLSLINHEPLLYPTVKDISPETLALTGDENVFVKYASMAEYSIGATARKEAEIVTQSIQCGSKTVEGLGQGIIDDVESGTFIFNATDSRGIRAETVVVERQLIDYLKPTCYQELEIGLAGETGATINLKIKGNYFNGSFGATPNTIKLEVRYGEANGTMGAWQVITGTPTFNGNTYELNTTFTGFSYAKAYTFQSRITDKILYAQSAQYTIRMLPVFDWSETDFNFNVPVKMHNETVLRHNEEANNTVLSASGGHIYIRPGGTDDTSGETIIYPDGSIQFGGEVTFADGTTGGGAVDPTEYLADYVVETGTEAMGTNGTWYWTKWNSGKAECYGVRNYGNMACTEAWGSMYMSTSVFSQALPTGLFSAAPDYVDISLHHTTGGGGGWITISSQGEPTATTTSGFRVIRPTSATIQKAHICFQVIGRWK